MMVLFIFSICSINQSFLVHNPILEITQSSGVQAFIKIQKAKNSLNGGEAERQEDSRRTPNQTDGPRM